MYKCKNSQEMNVNNHREFEKHVKSIRGNTAGKQEKSNNHYVLGKIKKRERNK